MKIGIGIDTGGTCTDAVALDMDTQKLLAKGKTLTTREDLSIGIGKALDMLPQDLIRDASVVSLSTTLATNAIIEGKGCRAKLVLFGLTDEYIKRMHAPENYKLTEDRVLVIDTHGSADGLIVDEPDWDALFAEHGEWLSDADALSAVEVWADDTGAPNEKRFKEQAEARTGIKCVSASEITSGINVFARGATALLNARLFPIVEEFVDVAEKDFRKRGCKAPIMVVRSDSSLMSSGLALSRPVETMLCGPAASVLAGRSFSGCKDYIVVDMGGTSTDISVVTDGKTQTDEAGIRVAEWNTSVRGVKVYPFNLGGDSAVRLVSKEPQLFPRRVRSVCSAAVQWPQIKDQLAELLASGHHNNKFPLHEFYYLVREPEHLDHFDQKEQKLIKACRKGPVLLESLERVARLDIYGLDTERLESEGIIMRIGLTPTDFMHIKGDYLEFDREASVLAARYMQQEIDGRPIGEITEDDALALADRVYDITEAKMFENIVQMMLERQYPAEFSDGLDPQTLFLIRQAWKDRNSAAPGLFTQLFRTSHTLVGIGAPTHLFIPEVAKALGTPCVLPENAEVANAIGALQADLNAVVRVGISERYIFDEGRPFFIVHAPTGSRRILKLEDAMAFAKEEAEKAAVEEARARGASGDIKVSSHEEFIMVTSSTGTKVKLGRQIVATAEVR